MGVKMECDYKGELHCRLVHGPSGSTLETDAPKDNAGKGEAFSPTDLVGAAFVSCAITTMAIKGTKEGIPFATASGRVTKEMTREAPRRIAALELDITMPAGLAKPERTRLEEIARTCPVALSLSPDIVAALRFSYPD